MERKKMLLLETKLKEKKLMLKALKSTIKCRNQTKNYRKSIDQKLYQKL